LAEHDNPCSTRMRLRPRKPESDLRLRWHYPVPAENDTSEVRCARKLRQMRIRRHLRQAAGAALIAATIGTGAVVTMAAPAGAARPDVCRIAYQYSRYAIYRWSRSTGSEAYFWYASLEYAAKGLAPDEPPKVTAPAGSGTKPVPSLVPARRRYTRRSRIQSRSSFAQAGRTALVGRAGGRARSWEMRLSGNRGGVESGGDRLP